MCTHILQSTAAQKFEALCSPEHVRLFRSTEIRCQNPATTNCAFQFSVDIALLSSPIFATALLIGTQNMIFYKSNTTIYYYYYYYYYVEISDKWKHVSAFSYVN
jgi:hypothetical protein